MIKVKVLVSIFGFFLFYGTGAYATNTANCSGCRGTNASMWQCDGKSCPTYNRVGCSCSKRIGEICPTFICTLQGGCRARDCHPSLVKKHHQSCTAWIPCSGQPRDCKMNPNGKQKTVCDNWRRCTNINCM